MIDGVALEGERPRQTASVEDIGLEREEECHARDGVDAADEELDRNVAKADEGGVLLGVEESLDG
eukprot:1209379-Rhodomonas_salina.1